MAGAALSTTTSTQLALASLMGMGLLHIASRNNKSSAVGPYWLVKCAMMWAYNFYLDEMGLLTFDFKMRSFLIATPIVKFFHFNRLKTERDRSLYIFSVLNDAVMVFLQLKVIIPNLVGPLFALYPIVDFSLKIGMELVQHRMLFANTPYDILLSDNPLDFSFAFILSGLFWMMGTTVDFDKPATHMDFPVFVLFAVMIDLTFGCIHYLCHIVPWLVKHHMIHHKYGKERLNAFATFCADLLDSFLMNLSIAFLPALIVYRAQTYNVAYAELTFVSATTHLKFIQNQMNLLFFFEWDVLDMIFGATRFGCFHSEHHLTLNERYSAYGMVSDGTIRAIMAQFGYYDRKSSKCAKD